MGGVRIECSLSIWIRTSEPPSSAVAGHSGCPWGVAAPHEQGPGSQADGQVGPCPISGPATLHEGPRQPIFPTSGRSPTAAATSSDTVRAALSRASRWAGRATAWGVGQSASSRLSSATPLLLSRCAALAFPHQQAARIASSKPLCGRSSFGWAPIISRPQARLKGAGAGPALHVHLLSHVSYRSAASFLSIVYSWIASTV